MFMLFIFTLSYGLRAVYLIIMAEEYSAFSNVYKDQII
jgi:hypothetical protein